jgi:hypothetical protein
LGKQSVALVDEEQGGIIAWFGGNKPQHMAYTVLEMLQDL